MADGSSMTMERVAFDSRGFRDALGAFVTGVTIVTAEDAAGRRTGITCNSFSSLSLDPPMVLWSLRRASTTMPVFAAAEHFAVHILSAEQEALARQFARSAEDRFEGVVTAAGLGNAPLLDHCVARFECAKHATIDGGDHLIFIGLVGAFEHTPERVPLTFSRGRMGAFGFAPSDAR